MILPSRVGFTVEWETGSISERNGRPIKKSFESRSRKEVEEKRKEMLNKGYKVSKIMECIF